MTHRSPCRSRASPSSCLWRPGRAFIRETFGARVVDEGANLAIIEATSPGDFLFRERVGGIWLASPVQVYLDLLRGEGRSKEMAEHLRKKRIGF